MASSQFSWNDDYIYRSELGSSKILTFWQLQTSSLQHPLAIESLMKFWFFSGKCTSVSRSIFSKVFYPNYGCIGLIYYMDILHVYIETSLFSHKITFLRTRKKLLVFHHSVPKWIIIIPQHFSLSCLAPEKSVFMIKLIVKLKTAF